MRLFISILFIHLFFAQQVASVLISQAKRIKPLETYYNEVVTIIHGKSHTKLEGEKRTALETIFYLFEKEEHSGHVKIFKIDHKGVKLSLGLNRDEKFFSYEDLVNSPSLNSKISEAIRKVQRNIKMTVIDDAFLQINSQLNAFTAVLNPLSYRVIPSYEESWQTLADVQNSNLPIIFGKTLVELLSSVAQYQEGKISNDLKSKRDYELKYNKIQPFLFAWITLLISVLLMLFFQMKKTKLVDIVSKIFFSIGFLLLIVGFILRVLISGRAPVTNMYESVIWVGFTGLTIAAFYMFNRKIKNERMVIYSSVAATFAILATDLLPNVFDATISPLQPVLRSTFWLSTHVLVITFSYGAFAVSFLISLVALVRFVMNKPFLKETEKLNYNIIKIGTISLAAGTLLGAIWADYSWGRFWGWDPKETWAAITLVMYMIILHGRFSGWVRKELNYAYSSFAFLSVLMAWYGVNYILGAGLHSYGFSKAGNDWFYYILFFISIFCFYAVRKFNIENKNTQTSQSYSTKMKEGRI